MARSPSSKTPPPAAKSYANSIVIPKNTPIPCQQSQTYVTSEDNERVIEVAITQGEDTDPKYVDVIGKIALEVPPAGRPDAKSR